MCRHSHRHALHCIVPPYILSRIVRSGLGVRILPAAARRRAIAPVTGPAVLARTMRIVGSTSRPRIAIARSSGEPFLAICDRI